MHRNQCLLLPFTFFIVCLVNEIHGTQNELVAITVATEETDGFRRFINSAKKYKVSVTVLGMGEEWRGGDIQRYGGGGQKVRFLRKELEKYKDDKDQILMFSDSYDAILSAGPEEILKSFKKFDSKVVFSAEDFCWPDPSLADKYPEVKHNEKRFLNSGGIIGYAPQFYEIVTSSDIQDKDDDQLFYTKVFLDETLRKKFSIKLDTRGEIFQNLNGALDDVQLKFKGATSYMYNSKTGNMPHVIHGNGPIKVQFNSLTNYLTDNWTPSNGCQSCKQNTISLAGLKDDDYPSVMVAVFIDHPTPFLKEFLQQLLDLKYPKSRIDLYIHYADEFHTKDVGNFLALFEGEYNSVKVLGPGQDLNEWDARNRALVECEKKACQYYFAINSNAQIENAQTLNHLIEANRSVIAPLLMRPGKMWSNFWGALSPTGYYKRSDDYIEIINDSKKGQWNVPYITEVMLIHGYLIPKLHGGYKDGDLDSDMALCKRAREKGIFMYVDNQKYFGHLVNSDNFETTHKHNDLYTMSENRYTWEKKYLHPQYKAHLDGTVPTAEPCTDVFWFPLVTETFCWHLIEEVENYGQWSSGKHEDERLAGGYENVPTVDIHMNQIGFEQQWLDILQSYISPMAAKSFMGYYPEDARLEGGYENVPTVDIHTNQIGWEDQWLDILENYIEPMTEYVFEGYVGESRAIMNFVVRYKPGEQDHLRPHHDTSTYSVNLALNRPGIDFEGGGTSFLRYNCKVTSSKQGWTLIHPGRLTHWHEGLKTTNGTRYIMVSFVDP